MLAAVGMLLLVALPSWAAKKEVPSIQVIAVHQVTDEGKAAFDFFSSEYAHDCNDKASNRFRSYSRHDVVAERKFQLILQALEHDYQVSVEPLGCEGDALRVGRIGIRKWWSSA